MGSMAVGFGVSVVCYLACSVLKPLGGYDDSLDAFGVHGVGGAWGALASGLFCVTYGAPAEGAITSNMQQVMIQLKGIGFTAVFAPLMSFVILFGLKLVFGSLRVTDEQEFEGLDVSEHSEAAYSMSTGSSMAGGHGSHGSEGAASLATAHH
jgi:Amt family ammonium transporter